ncbi:OLC1v1019820C1 [Oldenlandia corymbosa var. corymbosa]|uniref:Calcium-transporting ATPase n=1 Tax=Oldenlandia corymbosa var. corymbosa TaxID=529605 RepID=A0AAV1EFD7_OLDCO|nr:OLC1v1019820C1 [Oldenlandia corymbosa var. corymbosa]
MLSSKSRVGDFPVVSEDCIWEILKWVPVKSLTRFKCVSKLWQSIIQNPLFAQSYQGGFKGLLLNLSHGEGYMKYTFFHLNISSIENDNVARISGFHTVNMRRMNRMSPVNGLVCFYHGKYSCIYNIATREKMDLPVSINDSEKCDYHLGFDPVNKLYKVLKTCPVYDRFHGYKRVACSSVVANKRGACSSFVANLNSEILTLGVDISWRTIDPAPWELRNSAYCGSNGGLYWDAQRLLGTERRFLHFDLVDEIFAFIHKPHPRIRFRWLFGPNPTLVSKHWVGGHMFPEKSLNLFFHNNNHPPIGATWTRHEIQGVVQSSSSSGGGYEAVTTLPTGEVIFMNTDSSTWKFPVPFYVYDPTTRELKECFLGDCPSSSASQQRFLDIVERSQKSILLVEALYYEENIISLSCLGEYSDAMFEDQSEITTIMDVEPPAFTTFDPSQATVLGTVVRMKDKRLLRDLGGVDGVIRALDSDAENGILGDDDDISTRKKIFGSNSNLYPKRDLVKGFYRCSLEAIKDPLIIILLFFAVVSLCVGIKEHGMVWPERGTKLLEIVAVVIISAVTNFWPITQTPEHLSAAKNQAYSPQVEVVRYGKWTKLAISEVVVGDIVFLKPGDQVPADGLFIDGHSLHLENLISSGGKSDHAEVGQENPFLFSGNMVADGYARMVVTAVGKNRRNMQPQVIWMMGKHAHELENLTSIIGWFGKAFAVSTFVWFLFRFCAEENNEEAITGGQEADIVELLIALVGMLATATIIALTSSLEGLLLAVKTTLAYSMRSLLKEQVLIKKPLICHQVASVDTICFNKTGTLTSDSSEVKKFWLGLSSIEEVPHNLIAPNVLELLHQAIGLNTTQPRSSSTFASSLNSTEATIFDWATRQLGMEKESLRRSCTILEIEPFNPVNKSSGVLISRNNDNTIHVHRKGAPDVILPMCSHYYETTGIVNMMNKTTRALLEQIIEGMTERGLRCIAFAHRKTSIEEYFNFSRQQLTLLGLVGIKNPVRSGLRRVVRDCQRAGISIKLVTGDNILTAKAMAVRAGLLEPDTQLGDIVEGKEFRDFTAEEQMEKVDQIRILAGATPFDKFLMVQSLKKKGRVVAYVGGGLSDVQALKEANVGLCFGTEGGAEILKASSDIVIKSKNLPSVIEILKWGRGFYDSIQTYIQFLLTATFVDLVVDFVMTIFPNGFTLFHAVAVISPGEVPIPVFQLLWVKLILGTVAALSVLIKQPSDDLMSKPARDQNEPLMTDDMQRNISAQALYQILVLLAIHFRGKSLLKLNHNVKNTVIFNTYVLCQVFTLINAKLYDRKNIFQEMHSKKWFWGIIGIIIILEVVMVEVWKSIAGTARLDARQWGLCIIMAAASTPISWLIKNISPMKIPYLNSAQGSNLKSKIE